MPITPAMKMRIRARETPQRLTEEEKERRREEREMKRMRVPKFIPIFVVFILVGSTIVQLYFSVVSSPKMID